MAYKDRVSRLDPISPPVFDFAPVRPPFFTPPHSTPNANDNSKPEEDADNVEE